VRIILICVALASHGAEAKSAVAVDVYNLVFEYDPRIHQSFIDDLKKEIASLHAQSKQNVVMKNGRIESAVALQDMANVLLRHPDLRVKLDYYGNNESGRVDVNSLLSQARDVMVKNGIDQKRLLIGRYVKTNIKPFIRVVLIKD
jgi:hypothetical protein